MKKVITQFSLGLVIGLTPVLLSCNGNTPTASPPTASPSVTSPSASPTITLPSTSPQSSVVKTVKAEEFYKLVQTADNKEIFLIDVRTPSEFKEKHIANATMIDYNDASFESNISKLDKTKTYLVYCGSGKRSAGATAKMESLGFKNLYNLDSGLATWTQANYPVVQ